MKCIATIKSEHGAGLQGAAKELGLLAVCDNRVKQRKKRRTNRCFTIRPMRSPSDIIGTVAEDGDGKWNAYALKDEVELMVRLIETWEAAA